MMAMSGLVGDWYTNVYLEPRVCCAHRVCENSAHRVCDTLMRGHSLNASEDIKVIY